MRRIAAVLILLVCAACSDGGSSDGGGPGATVTLPPSLNTTSVPDGRVGAVYGANLVAGGGSGAGYVWEVASGALPPGLQLTGGTPTATIAGIPTSWGSFAFTVKVTDSAGKSALAGLQAIIQPDPPISIDTSPVPACVVGTAWQMALTTTGGTGTGYQWAITGGAAPPGIVLVPATPDAHLQGTATQPGVYNLTVQVTDSLGETAARQVSISAVWPPLTITTAALPTADTTAQYQATLSATGGSGVGYGWAITSGALPQGISLAGSALAGTPVQPGVYPITLQVTDSATNTALGNFVVTVTGPPPLVITTTQLAAGVEQSPYADSLIAGGGAPPYTWAVAQGTLPPGLALNGDQISGTPSQSGNFVFTVQVWDSGVFTQTRPLSINVVAPAPYGFTTPANLPYAVTGHVHTQLLETTSGALPLSGWQVTAGALPPGISLMTSQTWSAVGRARLEGTPTQLGTFQFTIRVTDAAARVATRNFTLEVRSGTGALVILTKDLGPWYTAVQIAPVPLTAAGITGLVFGWTVTAGSLPPGIIITNPGPGTFQLEGQPTLAGTYGFTLEVADSSLVPASRAFVVEVDPAGGIVLFFGEPVRERTLFVLPATADMAGSRIATLRAEMTATIRDLPTGHEFDIIAFGSQFPAAQNFCTQFSGALTSATAAGKNNAIAWVNGPSTNPGGDNTSYAALQRACTTYPSTLRAMFYVNSSAPATSGSAGQILADFPAWFSNFQDCHMTAVGMGLTGATMQYMQAVAALAGGVYISR